MAAVIDAVAGRLRALVTAIRPARGQRSPGAGASAAPVPRRAEAAAGERSASPRQPGTRVVDPAGRGDHVTIGEAIAAAAPNERILIRPGVYGEGLILDKPLELVGDGTAGTVFVEAKGTSALRFNATAGRIANLSLAQQGGGNWPALEIEDGRLEVVDCEVTGQGTAVVEIRGGADPLLLRNRICDGKGDGVLIRDGSRGRLEDNEVSGNTGVGVRITTGSQPTLRRNRIHEGRGNGVYIDDAGGDLEENDVFENSQVEVAVTNGSAPTLRRNRIHNGRGDGVYLWHHGAGVLEENDIFANAGSGVVIGAAGNPTLRGNRIRENGRVAIRARDAGGGTIQGNDLSGNAQGAWDVAADCEPFLTRDDNLE